MMLVHIYSIHMISYYLVTKKTTEKQIFCGKLLPP